MACKRSAVQSRYPPLFKFLLFYRLKLIGRFTSIDPVHTFVCFFHPDLELLYSCSGCLNISIPDPVLFSDGLIP